MKSTPTNDVPDGWATDALNTAIEAARLADPLFDGPHGQRHIALPETFKLHNVSDPHALPPHIIQAVTVDERASLSAYTNRFSDTRSILIADYDNGTISARLDWHGDNMEGELQAEPGQHTCTLRLRPSEEFTRWNKVQGKLMTQAEFAAFLEENATDIVDPEPTTMIEISRDLEAVQGVNFKSSTRLESGDRTFVYETETKTKGDVKIPREFTLHIPLYQGEDATHIRCALRFRVEAGGLFLGFEWRRVEYQRQAYFRQIATTAAEETGLPLFLGRAA
jgi:uncharacterized protein YfdQ (DUF2303 family)